jgi:hypothetical protein
MMHGIRVFLLALAVSSGFSATRPRAPETEFRRVFSLNPDGRVVIHNLYGAVRIAAWDRNAVEVTALKNGGDFGDLADARVVVESQSPELVSIRTQYGASGAVHPASVEYRISVPRGATLEEIRVVNGELSLTGLKGPVKASSVNGAIKAEKLGGRADLSTVNGRLEADFERISESNPISLRSVNGPISLSLPRGGATVVAENLSGGIESDVGGVSPGGHRLRAVLRGGGAPIRLNNTNGGISIRSSGRRRALIPASF